MGLIITIAVGAILGWLSAAVTGTAATKSGRKIAAGIFGALLGAFFLGPLIGGGDLLSMTLYPETPVIAFAGASVLLLVAHLVRRRKGRPQIEDDPDESFELERDVERY